MAPEAAAPKLAILAGGGPLPKKVIAACAGMGRPFAVFAIAGEADADLAAAAFAHIEMAGYGRTLDLIKAAECRDVIMVGRVRRPDFARLRPDWRAIKILPRVVAAARRGDDALLRELGAILESDGLRLIGVDEVAAELLCPAGPLGRMAPDAAAAADIARGAEVVAALGPFDVGQGAVVCDGLVLAVEAAEGTDAMLARCAGLPEAIRGTQERRRGVLVKRPKPGQERRIDLPTIGVDTVLGAHAAGLAGIAVAAGGALVMDRALMIEKADALGLFVYGFSVSGA